jgi:hypothetical protein
MNQEPLSDLTRLILLEEVKQLKARYCRLIDLKRWAELEQVFAPDVHVEIQGGSGGPDDAQRFSDRSSFLAGLRELMGPLRTVHHVHAPEIEILSATKAFGTWAVADRLVFPRGSPAGTLQGYGYYDEQYDRSSGAWVITDLRLSRVLSEADG